MSRMRTIAIPVDVYRSIQAVAGEYRKLGQIVDHADRKEWDEWAHDVVVFLTESQKAEAEALCKQRDTVQESLSETNTARWERDAEEREAVRAIESGSKRLAALDASEDASVATLRLGLCRSYERGLTGEALENWLRQNAVLDGLIKSLADNADKRSELMGALEQATTVRETAAKATKDAIASAIPLTALVDRSQHELKTMLGYADVHAKVEIGIAAACSKHGLSRDRCYDLMKHAVRGRLTIK